MFFNHLLALPGNYKPTIRSFWHPPGDPFLARGFGIPSTSFSNSVYNAAPFTIGGSWHSSCPLATNIDNSWQGKPPGLCRIGGSLSCWGLVSLLSILWLWGFMVPVESTTSWIFGWHIPWLECRNWHYYSTDSLFKRCTGRPPIKNNGTTTSFTWIATSVHHDEGHPIVLGRRSSTDLLRFHLKLTCMKLYKERQNLKSRYKYIVLSFLSVFRYWPYAHPSPSRSPAIRRKEPSYST